jgi:hypothetical protein
MRKVMPVVILFCAAMAVSAGSLSAQMPRGERFLVQEIAVDPSMAIKFREAMKESVALSIKHGSPYAWTAYRGDDGRYYFLHAIKDLTDIEIMYKYYGGLAAKDAQGFKSLSGKFLGTYEYSRDAVYTYRSELSYMPADPYYPPAEMRFIRLDIWFVEPEREAEAERAMAELHALAKTKGVRDITFCMVGGMGTEQPLYIYGTPDKDETEYMKHYAEMWKLLDDEAAAPYHQGLRAVRRRESRRLWYDEELSYAPGPEVTVKPK